MRDRSHLKETQRSQHRNIPAPARFFVISACTLHLIHNWCFFFIILNVSFCLYLQHTQHKHPYIRRHSNPQPQQEIDRRTSPQTARPLVQTNGATHSKYRPKYNAAEKVNVFVFNLVPRNESMLGNGDIAPRILNSDSRLRCMVSFTLRPLYLRRKRRYPFGQRLSGAKSWSGCFSRDTVVLRMPRIEPYILGHPIDSLDIIMTELFGVK